MFELATQRARGAIAIVLITATAMAILLGQSLLQPTGAYAAPLEQPKPTTHPVEGRENCLMCHQPGAGVKPAPADHAGRPKESCTTCHQPAAAAAKPAAAAPAQPAAAAPAQPAAAAPAQPAAAAPAQPAAGAPAQGAAAKPAQAPQAGTTAPTIASTPAVKAPVKVDPAATTAACRTCHSRPEFATVAEVAPRSDTQKELDANRVYAHRSIGCATCHQGDPHKNPTPITKTSIAQACGQCHSTQQQAHELSVHGQSLAAGGKDAATCIDCHSTQNTPHSIARVLSTDSPVYRGSVASTCAKCHAKTDVMDQYDVPTEVYKSYMTTFHGKANVLSPYEITQHPKATCINCHGYHDIKSAADPASPVAKANLPTTCGGCHPGAGEQFASGWLGHKEATPEQFPAVYFAERFFFFFTSSVLTFGVIFMVALELGSWILRRKPTEH